MKKLNFNINCREGEITMSKQLISNLLRDYKVLKKKKSFIHLIRHAQKQKKQPNQGENSILLTEKGKNDAQEFGKNFVKLYKKIDLIKSSPIKRCIETADAILKGANENRNIIQSKHLGDPGVYVYDDKAAIKVFEDFGIEYIIRAQLEKKDLPGIRDIESGSIKILEELVKDLEKNTIYIEISHDAIIATLICYLTNEFITLDNWIDYLEGIFFWNNNKENYSILWRGHIFDISEKINELI